MNKFLFVIFALLLACECSFAQTKFSTKECLFKDGKTKIEISHCNAIYSIAQYFDMIDKNSKYVPGPFACSRYIPENDSIPFYSGDEYHNDLFKLTRKILYSNYDSTMSYIKDVGLLNGTKTYRDSIYNILFLCEYSTRNLCCSRQNVCDLWSYGSFNVDKQLSSLSGFAKIIHYDEFLEDNYYIYYDYITNRVPCIEDIRLWLNEMFDANYEGFNFFTSPFSNPNCREIYENEEKSIVTVIGGFYALEELNCDNIDVDSFVISRYDSDFYLFEMLMDCYADRFEEKKYISYDYTYIRAILAMYLLYCNDMQSNEIFEREKCIISYRVGTQIFSDEIEPIYNKLLQLRNKKEKNLFHIYLDMLENQCVY